MGFPLFACAATDFPLLFVPARTLLDLSVGDVKTRRVSPGSACRRSARLLAAWPAPRVSGANPRRVLPVRGPAETSTAGRGSRGRRLDGMEEARPAQAGGLSSSSCFRKGMTPGMTHLSHISSILLWK